MNRPSWGQWVMCFVLLAGPTANLVTAGEIPLLMPKVKPQEPDTYLCYEKKIDEELYITEFKPNASMMVAHHMLIYGCSDPGSTSGTPWDCGEMHTSSSGAFKQGPVCKDSGRIIYAWAMDAPKLKLPNDVAFKVGKNTPVKYLVIQVHYKDVTRFLPPSQEKDDSGVFLTTTTKPRAKTAGVYLVAANGAVPPHSVTYMEAACTFQEPVTLHPFAFRVHTHKLGKVVSGYRIRNGKWTEIGRRSPQKPQMFYPVDDTSLDVVKGDIIAARCTMDNPSSKEVGIGPTSDDEMCNFYMMYYLSGSQDVKDPICVSPGPPGWNWDNLNGIHIENIPFMASVDPETNNWFKETQKQMSDWASSLKQQGENLQQQIQNSMTNFLGDFPSYSGFQQPIIPPLNEFNYGNAYENQYNAPQYQYDYDGQYHYDHEAPGNAPTFKKETVLSQSPISQSSAKYKYQNGKLVKVYDSEYENPANTGDADSLIKGSVLKETPISQSSAKYKYVNGKLVKVSDNANQQKIQPLIPPIQPISDTKFPQLDFKFPEIKMPQIKIPEFPAGKSAASGPQSSETFSTFDDKEGGKGYQHVKSSNNAQEFNVPGGKGFVQSSSKSSSSGFHKSSSFML